MMLTSLFNLPGKRSLTPFFLALTLVACARWDDAMRADVDGYTLLLKTDPAPIEVGLGATVSVRIEDGEGGTVRGCNASFRQHMPGMEMATDDVIVAIREERSGVYSGESPEYSMGGDWRIEVSFECGPRRGTAHFDFHLDWPE